MAVLLGESRGPAKRDAVDACAAMRELAGGGTARRTDMMVKRFVMIAALALSGVAGAAPTGASAREFKQARPQHARASDVSAQGIRRYARPRIEINRGGPLLYRRCSDDYELQYRPSGTVLFPYQHCWWVRG